MRKPLIDKFEEGGVERQGKCRGDQPTPQEGSGEQPRRLTFASIKEPEYRKGHQSKQA